MGPTYSQGSLWERGRKIRSIVAGAEAMGPGANECRWPLGAEKGKETNSLLKAPQAPLTLILDPLIPKTVREGIRVILSY